MSRDELGTPAGCCAAAMSWAPRREVISCRASSFLFLPSYETRYSYGDYDSAIAE